jgi:hypothetical protein
MACFDALLAVHDEIWVKVWSINRVDRENAQTRSEARRLLGEISASGLKTMAFYNHGDISQLELVKSIAINFIIKCREYPLCRYSLSQVRHV